MPNCVNSPILQFADDVKMFRAIGGAADFQQLLTSIILSTGPLNGN